MSAITRSSIPTCLLALGLATPFCTHATLRQNWGYGNPADACQLSIPTTDTQVRPKASGFRNESTGKSAFVICGYNTPSYDSTSKQILIYFTSMDGVSRNISCTAVSGMAGAEDMFYSTKSISSTAAGTYTALLWTAADFGGTTDIPYGEAPSVTCTLPPQTAITQVINAFDYEIGS
jgi:hypothetical protein